MDQNLSGRIRERAYELWAASGCRDGEAEQHWLAAEREISEAQFSAGPVKSPAKRSVSRAAKPAEQTSRGIGSARAIA